MDLWSYLDNIFLQDIVLTGPWTHTNICCNDVATLVGSHLSGPSDFSRLKATYYSITWEANCCEISASVIIFTAMCYCLNIYMKINIAFHRKVSEERSLQSSVLLNFMLYFWWLIILVEIFGFECYVFVFNALICYWYLANWNSWSSQSLTRNFWLEFGFKDPPHCCRNLQFKRHMPCFLLMAKWEYHNIVFSLI